MKIYWDSSALLKALGDDDIRRRLNQSGGVTRTHALAEVFSTITGGGVGLRVTADVAAQLIQQLGDNLEFCDLTAQEVLAALAHARAKGVRGGRVHDYLHAVAAKKAKAGLLLTSDKFDFTDLFEKVEVL